MKLVPPYTVLEIVRKLEHAGYEAWCVGGAIRDAMLGQTHLDWDIATSARPEQVQKLFRRTVPLGIEFGTVGVLDSDGVMHEVTTFRKDVETDGRHARVVFGVSLDEDLARRDFTVNAMAYSPSRDLLHDPFGGRDDLNRKLLRTVGLADERMMEDRLRALRAIRFSARFGLQIDGDTWAAVCRSAPFMNRLSPERVRQEMEKTMDQVLQPSAAFTLWRDSGAFQTLVPALASVDDAALACVDCLALPRLRTRPGRRSNRIAALFLSLGATQVRTTMRDLRFSNSESAWVTGQVERFWLHESGMREELMRGDLPSRISVRRWVAAVGRMRAAPLMRLCIASWASRQLPGTPVPNAPNYPALYRMVVSTAFRDPVELADLAIDGDDLRAAGIPTGPRMGATLAKLLGAVVENPDMNQRDLLMKLALSETNRTHAGQ